MTERTVVDDVLSDGADMPMFVGLAMRLVAGDAAKDLRAMLERLRALQQKKEAMLAYLAALRRFRVLVRCKARERGIDPCRTNERDRAILAEVFTKDAHTFDGGEAACEACIPARVPPSTVKTVIQLDNEIALWEDRLAKLADSVQLTEVDMQSIVQKQQQALQMLGSVMQGPQNATAGRAQTVR